MRWKDWRLPAVLLGPILAAAFIFSPGPAGSAAAQGCRVPPRNVHDLMCHLPPQECGPGLICLDALTILIIVLSLVGAGFLWFLVDLLCSRCRQPVMDKLDVLKTGLDAVKGDTGKILAATGRLEENCKKIGEKVEQIDGKVDAVAADTKKIIKKIKHRLPKRPRTWPPYSYYSSSSCCTVSRSRDGRSSHIERRVDQFEDRFDRLEDRIKRIFDRLEEKLAGK